ncbi:MAG: hypothetical protein FD146_2124 [Anaerolineaceae bacterium]|nr:MAG: hypothetical protein FD146_2124 [Anaerolineaceae bacterium]
MTSTVSLEGVKKAVFFPFQGKGWGTKLLIGSALGLANYIIPIVPLIPLYGYAGQIAKRVLIQDEDPELPDWNDWGALFSDGIRIFGATIIYMLPGLLLTFGGYFLMFGMNFAFMLDPSFANSPEAIAPFLLGSMAGVFIGMLVMMLGMFLMFVTGLFLPPALGHLIAKGQFAAAFRVKEWWAVFRANFSGYLLMFALTYGINMILVWVVYLFYFTVVLCFVMPFAMAAATFLMSAIHFSLLAVTYRDGARKLEKA